MENVTDMMDGYIGYIYIIYHIHPEILRLDISNIYHILYPSRYIGLLVLYQRQKADSQNSFLLLETRRIMPYCTEIRISINTDSNFLKVIVFC